MFGVSVLSIVPCRKEPSSRSELVTQLLFGELVQILEKKDDWVLIRIFNDGYEGWINAQQFHPLSESQHNDLSELETPLVSGITGLVEQKNPPASIPLVMGCSLPGLVTKSFMLGDRIFSYSGNYHLPTAPQKDKIYSFASGYMNAPYLWGGRTVFGIDCSGFTQAVYKFCGYQLPRDAWQQSEHGSTLSFLEEAEEGDLAFFDNEDGKIVHTGILLGENRIMHAHGRVRIDRIDHEGIFNEEQKKYSHHLRTIKRII